MTPIVRRVIAGLGANAFGQGINVAIQVLSLPLFLRWWDLATYGTWLMLSAIPAYLSMADVGMVTVAGNQMTMAMGRGDTTEANSVFQSVLALMTIICGALASLAVPILLLLPLPGVTGFDERAALLALAWAVLLAFFGGLADIVFKSTHRFAMGVTLGNLTRLAEWGGGVGGLFLFGSFTAVAIGALAARIAGTMAAIAIARRDDGLDIRWGFAQARRADVLSMVRPAAAFMAFPLANALSFQGVTLLVGHSFGPAVVAVFNTYRTLARVAVQVTGIFSVSLWPEFSRLYGLGGATALAPVYKRAAILGASLALGVSVTLYPCAPVVLRVWTHGKVDFEPLMMALLLAYAAAGGLAHVPRVLLMATNLHTAFAQWALVSAGSVLILAYMLGQSFGVNGAAIAMLLTEMFVAAICLALVQRLMRETPIAAGAHP